MRLVVLVFWAVFAVPVAAAASDPLSGVPAAPASSPVPSTPVAPIPTPSAPVQLGRARLLVLDLKAQDVAPAVAETLTRAVVNGLASYRTLEVISGDDVRRLLELEATRSAAGCTDQGTCLAEVAGALGAQLVVFGSVARLGDVHVVSLDLFDAQAARALGRVQTRARRVERLPARIEPRLHDLVAPWHAEYNLVMPVRPTAPDDGPGIVPWAVAGAGATGVAVGVFGVVAGVGRWNDYQASRSAILAAEERFTTEPGALDTARDAHGTLAAARDDWNRWGFLAVDVGVAVAVVGAAAAVAGTAWGAMALADADEDLPVGGQQ